MDKQPPSTSIAAESPKKLSKIQPLFQKKFRYRNNAEWSLPPFKELYTEYYQIESLQKLKQELNDVKHLLNDYQVEVWSRHTKKQNPCHSVPTVLKNDIKAEFVTIAWCKLFECLHQYNVVKSGRLNSLHLCEAPGAFVAALNHYLYSTYDEVNFNWLATTLNPYYEGHSDHAMISDDRFILDTFNHWVFFEDFTGNLIDRNNIHYLAKKCSEELGEVHLITADGSTDCIDKPDNQEDHVSTLHFTEMCAALLILAKGGSFILKVFTLFEANSVSAIYLLNCVFKEVNIFKPATSKRGNSEMYCICVDYHKPDNIEEYLSIMMDKLTNSNVFPLIPKRCIPHLFYFQHEVCVRRFMHEQIGAIEENIRTYECKNRVRDQQQEQFTKQVYQYYLEYYKVRPIAPENRILSFENGIKKIKSNAIYFHKGSYNQRQTGDELNSTEKWFVLIRNLNQMEKSIYWKYDQIAEFNHNLKNPIPIKTYRGKPIENIQNSRFVNPVVFSFKAKLSTVTGKDPLLHQNPHCELSASSASTTIVIDWETPSAHTEQRFILKILQTIIENNPEKVTFVNAPILTHYFVSVLWYLSVNAFEVCRFYDSGKIVLEKTSANCVDTLQRVQMLHKVLEAHEDILCAVDIVQLHKSSFPSALCEYNNQLLINNYKSAIKGSQ